MNNIELLSGPTGPYAHGYLVCRVKYSTGKIKIVTYHKYLYEKYYNVILDSDKIVHHKDENKNNNSIDNLIVTTIIKHPSLHKSKIKYVEIECKVCKKKFLKRKRDLRGRINCCCSRSCAGKLGWVDFK